MTATSRLYRLRIRNKADDADLLVISSVSGGTNPYLTTPPSGDGQAVDPITGAPTTGAYTFRVADAALADGSRVLTAQLADVYARQQLLALRAYGETSENGSAWTTLIFGYVLAVRLIDAIEYEIAVGDTRRKELSREIFKKASVQFPGVTCVIGGPVIGGFAGIIPDNGGWKFNVTQINASPGYIQIKFEEGFDPRKPPYTTRTTMTSAIVDYTKDWARPYFESATTWLSASTPIQGHFPQLRARLVPVGGTDADALYFVPLSEPAAISGAWWDPSMVGDNITRLAGADLISLWLPVDGTDVNGDAIVFAPALNDEYYVWVYALPVSKENPLHIYERPVDLWKKLRLELGYVAGVDYDDTNFAALTTLVNARLAGDPLTDVKLALRVTEPTKVPDFSLKTIYGPFRLSSRVADGLLHLFSISVLGNPTPTTIVTIDDLSGDEGTVFDLEESTVVTAVTLKQQIIRLWTTEEQDQPTADGLILSPNNPDTIENSADDIPQGLEHTVTIGDIPGMILLEPDSTDLTLNVPLPFEPLLAGIADEVFQRFGRGGIAGEISCLPNIGELVGDEVIVNLVHRPAAASSQSPISQRGGAKRVQIVQRTERPEGAVLRIMDSAVEIGGGGGGGGTDPTLAVVPDPSAFPAGAGNAQADWTDSYPQFWVTIQWEGHPPSDATFYLLYGGEQLLAPGTYSHVMTGLTSGWIVRCRIRYTDLTAVSAWSSYSNEVTVTTDNPGAGPTEYPIDLVASSPVTDEAHAEWTNSLAGLQLRIQWQTTTDVSGGPDTIWSNVAGGRSLLAADTVSNDITTEPLTFARFRVAYVNSFGVTGTYSPWSDPTPATF